MNKLMFFVFFIFLSLSCNSTLQEDNTIVEKIKKYCVNNNYCDIPMSNVVETDWDRMFVFTESASLEFVNKKLGFNYPFFEDVAKRIVFVKKNTVVYHEDQFPSVENAKDNELSFVLPDSVDYAEFTRQTALFRLIKVNVSNNVTLYKLSHIDK